MTDLLVDAKQWAKTPWLAFGRKKVSRVFYYSCQNYAANNLIKQLLWLIYCTLLKLQWTFKMK